MPNGPRRREQSVSAALSLAVVKLQEAGVPSPEVDAALLLEAVTGWRRTEQLVRRDHTLAPELWDDFQALLARRAAREPLQHVLGEATFLDLRLRVTPGVLVPRPETERLVELVLEELGSVPARAGDVAIDVGTGTGAIALALKAARPTLHVWATDVSPAALSLAEANAHRLGLRIEVRRSDLLADPGVAAAAATAVAIVSNPPYLPDADRGVVEPEVAVEPDQALYAGPDGLDVARRLARQTLDLVRPGALVALELDPRNAQEMAAEMDEAGFSDVRLEADLAGRDRFVLARR